MRSIVTGGNPVASVLTFLIVVLAVLSAVLARVTDHGGLYVVTALLALIAVLLPRTLMMANQWERAVVLRVGKLQGIRGPGLFVIIPFMDAVAAMLDQRIQTTEFNAESALSRDTVPVNIDAVIFWQVHDVEKAALEITDFRSAIARVAQTSLREMVGSSLLSTLLSDRRQADEVLRAEIARKIANWGITVHSVEIRDVGIPMALQDAMSRQAQAERERQARVLLGQAEVEVAQKFLDAAETYSKNPAALQLRAMNIIYETTKERGATILIPTSMVDAMNPGGILGLVAAAPAVAGRTPPVASK
jgi:regulator of protease activity HflC (stomatin/prohibitin superfamily)